MQSPVSMGPGFRLDSGLRVGFADALNGGAKAI